MIIASIRLTGMKVAKYSREGIEFLISYDDGESRALRKSISPGNSEETVDSVFQELKAEQKRLNKSFSMQRDDIFQGAIMVKFLNEENARHRMKAFLDSVAQKAATIRSKKEVSGYLEMINRIQRMECTF